MRNVSREQLVLAAGQDLYLAFVAGRSGPNTLRAVAHDLKVSFTAVRKLQNLGRQ